MSNRLKYKKRETQGVVAVQLALDTAGFTYQKWGGTQRCKAGDWIVNNNGDVYTVDCATFERTYHNAGPEAGPGTYLKITPVWAEVAREAGSVRTKEGATQYQTGDYLVFNEQQGGDAYAVPAEEFAEMYELSE